MAVGRIERERHILVQTIALRTVLVLAPDHGALNTECRLALFHADNGNTALVTRGTAAVPVKGAGGLGFIDAALGVGRAHGVAVLCRDAERLQYAVEVVFVRHPLIAARVLLGERGRDLFPVPALRFEQGLVVIARERGGLIVLHQRALATALTAGADLQRFRCRGFDHERLIVPARAICSGYRLRHGHGTDVACIVAVVFKDIGGRFLNDSVPSRGDAAVHTERGGNASYCAVVSVESAV